MAKKKLPDFSFSGIEYKPFVPEIKIPNFPDPKLEYYASAFHHRMAKYIMDFESNLDESLEVGAKLVTFGESVIIHVDNIGYWNPELITFQGFDSNGNKVQLIQHINQISFLLIALPRTNPDRPRVGYRLRKELEEEKQRSQEK